jgi:hypothetical protein
MSTLFTDSSVMKDGWVLGPDSEILFWVPPALRIGLLRPGNKLFIGEAIATRLDLTSFVHGESWYLCKEPEPLSIPDRREGLVSPKEAATDRQNCQKY